MRTFYYSHTTDDVVQSYQQDYSLSQNYTIFPQNLLGKLWNPCARILASAFGWIYTRLFLRVQVVGKEKLKPFKKIGYFVYGNHTQPLGDVFSPLTIYPIHNFYAIAGQANWGIPVIGKLLVRYGGLPVGKNLKQASQLIKAVTTVIQDKHGVVLIYPEAHVWPYYTKIRPFAETSFNFPVKLGAPCFTQTTTYQKTAWLKRPKITIYIDGPFYPKSNLPAKAAQTALYNEICNSLKTNAKLSNYKYCNYQKLQNQSEI